MKYQVFCRVTIKDDYRVTADNEEEAKEYAHKLFLEDYGMEENCAIPEVEMSVYTVRETK